MPSKTSPVVKQFVELALSSTGQEAVEQGEIPNPRIQFIKMLSKVVECEIDIKIEEKMTSLPLRLEPILVNNRSTNAVSNTIAS